MYLPNFPMKFRDVDKIINNCQNHMHPTKRTAVVALETIVNNILSKEIFVLRMNCKWK